MVGPLFRAQEGHMNLLHQTRVDTPTKTKGQYQVRIVLTPQNHDF